ncbi:GNAT family N-acyltransferase [Sphaerisporangium sp. NPDC005289]|uniref:GNAT family N-acetyltransferase n=1 Tax=Sphaerisporangium sp. NPDC005289 TaxID=3155247 RepID=UPI0033A0A3F6
MPMTEVLASQVRGGSVDEPLVRSDARPSAGPEKSLVHPGAAPPGPRAGQEQPLLHPRPDPGSEQASPRAHLEGPSPRAHLEGSSARAHLEAAGPRTRLEAASSRARLEAGRIVTEAPPRPGLGQGTLTDARGRYTVELAKDAADMRAAQRLRYEVFAEEMGAHLDSPISGLDVDRLDAYCDHLLVRSGDTVVGTYRMLAPGRSDRLYSEGEFDLSALAGIRGGMVEVGRTCVHPDHRGGTVIGLMWAGIARYMVAGGYTWLGGCCSVPLDDGGRAAAGVLDGIGLGPERYRVTPHDPWTGEGVARPDRFVVPPLLRGYLRLGAWICGMPAHDPMFGTADFFVLLSLANVDTRYLRHFLGVAE